VRFPAIAENAEPLQCPVYYGDAGISRSPSCGPHSKGTSPSMRVERRGRAQSPRRILIGGIAHETNVFSRVPTDFAQFRQRVYITGREMIAGFSGPAAFSTASRSSMRHRSHSSTLRQRRAAS
jgi:hypothetical protein